MNGRWWLILHRRVGAGVGGVGLGNGQESGEGRGHQQLK